jgi:hypothetical protein
MFDSANKADESKSDRTFALMTPPVVTNSIAAAPITLAGQSEGMRREKAPVPGASTVAGSYRFASTDTAAAAPVMLQRFYRTDAPATRQRAQATSLGSVAPVLTSFQLEQRGNEIRVVDADGSVYTGVLQTAQDELKKDAVATKNAPSQPARLQNYFFRVAGTNRNSKQNLVFSGNLIPLTNAPVTSVNRKPVGGTAGTLRGAMESPAQSVLSNMRISGKAVIGNQKEIEVDAVPAP